MKPLTLQLANPQVVALACDRLQRLDLSQGWEQVLRIKKDSRSLRQNRTFHGWMTEISQKFAEATGRFAPAKWWKEYFKEMFLGEESFEVNGKVVTRTRHTSDLNTADMAEFMTKVDHYCGSELNIYVTLPGQDY
jgi:hypothetical protein